VEQQTVVSFWTTFITTGFGTVWVSKTGVFLANASEQIYCSILVFLIQKHAMQQNLRSYQTLTVTHDSLSSWAGLGAALSTLYNQLSGPTSVFGTLNIVGYLGCISILHITIPALLSVQTFTATVAVVTPTFTVPDFENASYVKCVECSLK
jgi:hypothetical protein